MRAITFTLGLGLLAACSPSIPDSGAGVGFDNSLQAQQAREAALTTGQPLAAPSGLLQEPQESQGAIPATLPAQGGISAQPLPSAAARTSGQSDDIAAETAAALALASANSGQVPLQASPSNPSPQATSSISDENDFSAVSDRQSISSDAARIAQNRAQYQVIAPTALPTRAGSSDPNIVAYALKSNNPVGSKTFSRSGFNGASKAVRNCARFASADQAQIAFLAKGGPQKDRQGLDPDGDGYACAWDPAPYRRAAQN